MSTEATKEQRAAAATHVLGVCLPVIDWVNYGIDDGADNLDACIALARLLAEREHKLREEHRTQLVEYNDIVARNIARAVEGSDEWAMGDDVLRPALQKVIDAKIAAIAAQYQLRADLDAARARIAELEASVATFHEAWRGAEADCNAQVKRIAELELLLGKWCAAEVMCDVPERRKLLDETGSMLLAKKVGA